MNRQELRLTPKGLRQARYRRQFSSLEDLCHTVLSEPITSNISSEMESDIAEIEGCLAVIKEIRQEAVDEGY